MKRKRKLERIGDIAPHERPSNAEFACDTSGNKDACNAYLVKQHFCSHELSFDSHLF